MCLFFFFSHSFPVRCLCDVQFVATNARTVAAANGTVLGNCDDSFYTLSIPQLGGRAPIDIIEHEGVMMSGFFCCSILHSMCADDALANNYTDEYTVAATFCNDIVQGLQTNLNLDLCGTGTAEGNETVPGNGTEPDSGNYDICHVCGLANQEVTLPNTPFPGTNGLSCKQVQDQGLAGNISPDQCALIGGNINAIRNVCKCADKMGTTMAPTTAAPTTTTLAPTTAAPVTDTPSAAVRVMATTSSIMVLAVFISATIVSK